MIPLDTYYPFYIHAFSISTRTMGFLFEYIGLATLFQSAAPDLQALTYLIPSFFFTSHTYFFPKTFADFFSAIFLTVYTYQQGNTITWVTQNVCASVYKFSTNTLDYTRYALHNPMYGPTARPLEYSVLSPQSIRYKYRHKFFFNFPLFSHNPRFFFYNLSIYAIHHVHILASHDHQGRDRT